MTIYETAKGLALLPALIIVGLVIGLLPTLIGRRASALWLWLVTLFFYAASAPYTANRFAHWVESVPPLTDLSATKDAQAIVVLSAGASANGPEYGGAMLDEFSVIRVRYAAHLHRLTNLPILVSGGPIRDTNTSYAALMKTALEQDFGIPVQWAEARSKDTKENAAESASILKAAGIKKIVLVTQASHMPRSLDLFRTTGLEVVPAGTGYSTVTNDIPRDLIPRMSALTNTYLAMYEAMGQVWYRIRPRPEPPKPAEPKPQPV